MISKMIAKSYVKNEIKKQNSMTRKTERSSN